MKYIDFHQYRVRQHNPNILRIVLVSFVKLEFIIQILIVRIEYFSEMTDQMMNLLFSNILRSVYY